MDKIEPKTAVFDPLEEATLAAQVVCRGDRRKYFWAIIIGAVGMSIPI